MEVQNFMDEKQVIKFSWPIAKMVCFGEGAMELCMSEMLFSFFLSIYPQCGTPDFLVARRTTVCLDVS